MKKTEQSEKTKEFVKSVKTLLESGEVKFQKNVAEAAGISKDFTIYGAKHTRVIHLKNAGYTDGELMGITGHKDSTSLSKYLRDLGLTVDIEKLNKVSRKI